MGRRAADLTAPVPVLGVPALVGVRGWRTIAADRTAGALLHSWGPQYNIGVPTSPGVGRPSANYGMQLTGTQPAPSDGTQMSSSFINHDSEYKEILKSDKEKGAILKLKTRSSKSKKEVTFQTAECEASKDVNCSGESSQTCCRAKESQRNLHLSDNAGAKSKLKPARYSNGSVVDSEAIGGISVDEAEPVTSSFGKKHTQLHTQQSHQAENSGNPLLFSGARPVRTLQEIYNHCGGRQLDSPGTTSLVQKSTCFGEKGINSLLTTGHLTMNELDHKLHQSPFKISNERRPVSPQLYLREEFIHRKTGLPPCPLHPRSNLVVASNALFTQPSTFVSPKTVSVTKETVETKAPRHDIISQATRLHLTPQMATATKSNTPYSHTYPQNRGIPQRHLTRRNAPLSVCVSVHAAPDSTSPSLYTTAMAAGTISITNAHRRTTECSATLTSTENIAAANAKCENNVDGSKSKCTPMTGICHNVTLEPTVSGAAHKLKTFTQTAAVNQSSIPPCSGHQPQLRPSLSAVMDSSMLPAISSAHCSAAPHVPLSTLQQCISKQNSNKMSHYSIKPATSQCRSVHPKYTNTETTCVYAANPNAALNSLNNQNQTTALSGVAPYSASMCKKTLTTALRNSSTYLKTSPSAPTVSSSTLKEYQTNACMSAAVSLQSEKTQHNRELAWNSATQPGKDGGAQLRNESGSGCVASTSATDPTAVSELAKYQQRNTDASYRQPDICPRSDPVSGGNKVNSNPIRTLITESKHHENSSVSQATSLRNYISLIKPCGPRLHACMSTERHCEGYAELVGQRAACPPVNADDKTKKVGKFAARREDVKLDSSKEKHTHNPTASVIKIDGDANSVSESLNRLSLGSDTSSLAQANKGPKLLSAPTPPLNYQGNLYSGPEYGPIPPSSTTSPASRPHLHSIVRPDSKSDPSGSRPCPEHTGSAHSHPADVARLLPPSPQCCKSASLQQKLESVEASLAANKDRITTLLNIIHDLETAHTPSSGRQCNEAGQDLRNCTTCQKTACVVYSVEYDFRQQERHLMEVLNHSTSGNKAFSTRLARSLDISLLRNTIKHLTKSKVKSKKTCKTLFKWLPGRIQQKKTASKSHCEFE